MMTTELKQIIQSKFTELFNTSCQLFEAPGRINLIGEHTDYNEGFVLPAAIDKSIIFGVQKNHLNSFRFYSIDYDEYQEFNSTELLKDAKLWSKYLLGVLAQFQKEDITLQGFDCVFGGNIPLGAGLSSSAALECGFAFAINKLSGFHFSSFDLVKMAQKAEHEYAGVMCGIMDQYASIFGKKEQLIQLDCQTNTHEYFPLKMDHHILALVDTKVKHSLASSEYNNRKNECTEGVTYFQQFDKSIHSLRAVSIDMIENHINQPNATSYKRCKYVVEENDRVNKTTQALLQENYDEVGALMYQSHEGLQKLYEVSCPELDYLVELTREMPKVLGARMMGGGFGGCTLNLIEKGFSQDFEKDIKEKYKAQFQIDADVYFVKISEGTRDI